MEPYAIRKQIEKKPLLKRMFAGSTNMPLGAAGAFLGGGLLFLAGGVGFLLVGIFNKMIIFSIFSLPFLLLGGFAVILCGYSLLIRKLKIETEDGIQKKRRLSHYTYIQIPVTKVEDIRRVEGDEILLGSGRWVSADNPPEEEDFDNERQISLTVEWKFPEEDKNKKPNKHFIDEVYLKKGEPAPAEVTLGYDPLFPENFTISLKTQSSSHEYSECNDGIYYTR